jgi:hypothetical protein
MFYRLRRRVLVVGGATEYLAAYADAGMRGLESHAQVLAGFWSTEIGTLNQVVELLRFDDAAQAQVVLAELQADAAMQSLEDRVRALVRREELLELHDLLPGRPPEQTGNVYELRTYTLAPDGLESFATLTGGILPWRTRFSAPVGFWVDRRGARPLIVHLWPYRDLAERQRIRADVARHDEWRTFGGKVSASMEEMRSEIMLPAAFSPLR